jgi:hypothetical protein
MTHDALHSTPHHTLVLEYDWIPRHNAHHVKKKQ